MPALTIRHEMRDNLIISEDTGDEDEPIAVLLFAPDMTKFDHHHIEVSLERCKHLRDWLTELLDKHVPKVE